MSTAIPLAPASLLRRALYLDAVASGGLGLLLLAGGGLLAPLLALPEPLLRGAGAFLVPFAACLLWAARRESVSGAFVWSVIAINALWVIESIALLALDWVRPNTLGLAFVITQAASVALFAELEWFGLRAARRAVAAERA